MKTYTILEALKEINSTMPFAMNTITSIMYEDGSRCKFIVVDLGEKYFVDLDSGTYKLIE